jgi:hypothetical protein
VSRHIFVDETKHRDYLLAAGVVISSHLDQVRKNLRELVLPGQRRLHMNAESDSRRKLIAALVATSPVTATIYDAGRRYPTERDRRATCLQALVRNNAGHPDSILVLEQDETLP